MRTKRIFAILMASAMAFAAAACGGGNSSSSTSTTSTTGASDSASDAAGESAEASDTGSEDLEDIAQIEVMFWTLNTIPTDVDMLEEAINEITREKINTEVNLNIIEMGSYVQQLNLMIAGNEKLDLMVTLPGDSAHFNSMTSQNQLMDITDLLQEYASDLLEVVPENWLEGTMVDGRIFSVTSYGDKATPLAFVCRTDILEQTGIDPDTLKTADDFEELFAKVLEVDSSITPVAVGNQKILTTPYLIDSEGNFVKYDSLGDSDNALIGIMDEDGTTIQNNYLREDYIATSERFVEWYNNG